MIRLSTDPEVRLFVNSLEHRDPARLWVALREKYDTSLSQAGRISILERFHTSTMKPDTSVSAYISTLKSMRQELAGSEEEITERALLARLLSTLPDSFANEVRILKHKPLAEQTLDTIETWLVEHEASVALRKAKSAQTPTAPVLSPPEMRSLPQPVPDIAIVNTLEDVGNVANMAEVLADSNPTPKDKLSQT